MLPAGELGGSRQRHHNDDGDDDDDDDDDKGGDFYCIVGMMAEDADDYDEKLLTCQLYPDCLSSMPFVPNERLFTTLKIIFVGGVIFNININV